MKKISLYSKPLTVSWALLIIGLLATCNLAYIPLIFKDYNGMGGGFAVAAIGVVLIIVAISMFVVYGKLDREFKRMFNGDILLNFLLPTEIYQQYMVKEVKNIKSSNRIVLFTIIAFSVVFAVIFTIISQSTLFIIIFLSIDIFFVLVYFISTAARTGKVKKSKAVIYLSINAAYVFGQMHCWNMVGSNFISAEFADKTDNEYNLPCGYIEINYSAVAYPVPQIYTAVIPVPAEYVSQAIYSVNVLKSIYKI
jgi:prepilin signal peptidase PulO-like enzyme (type II secretory pathway)